MGFKVLGCWCLENAIVAICCLLVQGFGCLGFALRLLRSARFQVLFFVVGCSSFSVFLWQRFGAWGLESNLDLFCGLRFEAQSCKALLLRA